MSNPDIKQAPTTCLLCGTVGSHTTKIMQLKRQVLEILLINESPEWASIVDVYGR